jgi:hypothetical protein
MIIADAIQVLVRAGYAVQKKILERRGIGHHILLHRIAFMVKVMRDQR